MNPFVSLICVLFMEAITAFYKEWIRWKGCKSNRDIIAMFHWIQIVVIAYVLEDSYRCRKKLNFMYQWFDKEAEKI